MNETTQIRVMVIEDHQMVRQGLVALLAMQDDLEVVADVGDGESALAVFRQHRPDVTLVDLRLPKKDGVEVIRTLRAESPRSRLLVLTTYDGENDVSLALQAGASGYLLKGASATELTDAIRAVHGGRRYVPAELAERLLPRPAADSLTDREVDVLHRIARGMGNRDIGAELGISERTVKGHVNNLLSKLGVTDRTKALVVAIRRGLVRVE
jgi:two-component system NarL family response regulator